MNCYKSDRWPSDRFYGALQMQKSLKRYICEIFVAPRFSSFAAQSSPLRHAVRYSGKPGNDWPTVKTSASDPALIFRQ